ncbi:MAG: MgtC/SapB family protein [Burkholderiales bacterium]|nr:MgtC/SapB family protein [Burkholderiales bacterium]
MQGIQILQLTLAAILGITIGFERQLHGSPVGVRTYALVCMGSCLFGLISIYAHGSAIYDGKTSVDPTRISAQVVSGIGFLGAGIIFKENNRIKGITTAANIWFAAAIGLAVAYSMYLVAIFTSIVAVMLLSLNHFKFFIHLNVLLSYREKKFFNRVQQYFRNKFKNPNSKNNNLPNEGDIND